MLTALLMVVSLSACSPLGTLTSFFNDTPSVDVQVGKTNEKTVGAKITTEVTRTAEHIVEDSKVGTITGGTVTIDEDVPVWVWLLLVLGWILPSPIEIYKGLGNLFINIKKFIKE